MGWGTICIAAALVLAAEPIAIPAEPPLRSGAESSVPDARAASEQQIFADLASRNQARSEALLGYTASRTYQISQPNGKVHAQIEGRMEYQAPDRKRFTINSEAGSLLVRSLALKPLIATEIKTAAGKDRHDSAITPANYSLKLTGEEVVRGYRCYVLHATPRRVDRYLFEGKIWVDEQDSAVVRIEGRPAANLSFWIKHAEFVREYQKIGGFWLPMKDETLVDVRMYGKKLLRIEHRDYTVSNRLVELTALAAPAN